MSNGNGLRDIHLFELDQLSLCPRYFTIAYTHTAHTYNECSPPFGMLGSPIRYNTSRFRPTLAIIKEGTSTSKPSRRRKMCHALTDDATTYLFTRTEKPTESNSWHIPPRMRVSCRGIEIPGLWHAPPPIQCSDLATSFMFLLPKEIFIHFDNIIFYHSVNHSAFELIWVIFHHLALTLRV